MWYHYSNVCCANQIAFRKEGSQVLNLLSTCVTKRVRYTWRLVDFACWSQMLSHTVETMVTVRVPEFRWNIHRAYFYLKLHIPTANYYRCRTLGRVAGRATISKLFQLSMDMQKRTEQVAARSTQQLELAQQWTDMRLATCTREVSTVYSPDDSSDEVDNWFHVSFFLQEKSRCGE